MPICATGCARGPCWLWHAVHRGLKMAIPAFPVRRSSASVASLVVRRCPRRYSSSVSSPLSAIGSSELVILLSIAFLFSPGTAPTLMPPLAMLPLSILVHFYVAIVFIPSSVVVQDYPSFFSFLLPMLMMHPLPNPCWHGPCSCIASVHA